MEAKESLADIAYHFAIGQDGAIYEGRSIDARGAHVYQANSGRIGVLLLGDFQPGMEIPRIGIWVRWDLARGDDPGPTSAQVVSTVRLLRWLDYQYGIDSVLGHRQVNTTACPGDLCMPYIPYWQRWLDQ